MNANLQATDVVDGGPGATRAAELGTLLRRLAAGDGIDAASRFADGTGGRSPTRRGP